MTAASRKQRARLTEAMVAEVLRDIYPDAVRIPASLPGADILFTPGITVEVKARRDLDLTGWLKQATTRGSYEALPVVISRPDGYGVERINSWPAIVPVWVLIELLKRGGFGE